MRDELKPYHREFQAAVAVITNRRFGIEIAELQPIHNHGGGLVVNGQEISVQKDHVQENPKLSDNEMPEEKATAEVIESLGRDFMLLRTNDGIKKFFAPYAPLVRKAARAERKGVIVYPLNRMFGLT